MSHLRLNVSRRSKIAALRSVRPWLAVARQRRSWLTASEHGSQGVLIPSSTFTPPPCATAFAFRSHRLGSHSRGATSGLGLKTGGRILGRMDVLLRRAVALAAAYDAEARENRGRVTKLQAKEEAEIRGRISGGGSPRGKYARTRGTWIPRRQSSVFERRQTPARKS